MSDSNNKEFFQFPPDPKIPELDILSLASDLPHLSLTADIKKQPNVDNRWFLEVKKNQPEIKIEDKITNIMESVTTTLEDPPKNTAHVYTKADFIDLCNPTKWMNCGTVSLLSDWLNVHNKKRHETCCVRSSYISSIVQSEYESYECLKSENDKTKINDANTSLISSISRNMKIDKEKIPHCICMVQNQNNDHWALVCICNVKTISEGFIDVNKENWLAESEKIVSKDDFLKYSLPCFLVLDSFHASGKVKSEAAKLTAALRHWLTYDKNLNPSGHLLDAINMPHFQIESMQQPDNCNCNSY